MFALGCVCICGRNASGDSSDAGQFNWAIHKTRSQEELDVTSEQNVEKRGVFVRHSLQFRMIAMQLWKLANIILAVPRAV